MKPLFFTLASLSILTLYPVSAEDRMIPPNSELWAQIYEPDATKPVEISRKDPLRKKLFDLARPEIEKVTGKPILFVGNLKGYRNWALFTGSIQDKSGKPIFIDEFSSDGAVALFLRTVKGWVYVDGAAGHTDVFYEIWPEMYGMPKELIYQ